MIGKKEKRHIPRHSEGSENQNKLFKIQLRRRFGSSKRIYMIANRNTRSAPPRPPAIVPPSTLGIMTVTADDVRELMKLGGQQPTPTSFPLTSAALSSSWIHNRPRQTMSARPAANVLTTYARFFEPPPAAALSATTAERLRRLEARSTMSNRTSVLPTTAPVEQWSPRPPMNAPVRPPRKSKVPTTTVPSAASLKQTPSQRVAFQPKPYDEYDLEKLRKRVRLTTEDRILARAEYEEKLLSYRVIPRVL